MPEIAVVIPALNEAESIAVVLKQVPAELRTRIVVVDNNSSDATAEVARVAGATVVLETRRGYGYACAKGVQYLADSPFRPDIVVFLDGDNSDYPGEMTAVVKPIVEEGYDLVIGRRSMSIKGSMPPQQVWGNRVAGILIELVYGKRFHDIGPFRAINFDKLMELDMQDRTYGWTVEMQVKAIRKNMRIVEVPVSYRPRIGRSKISGTFRGAILAGYKIVYTIIKYMRWKGTA